MHKNNINQSARRYYYAASIPSSLSGQSIERPKKTIQEALDGTQTLTPPPSTSATAFVKEAEGGVYIVSDIALYDSVLFEGTQTSIVCSGLTGIEAANFMSFTPQTTVSLTDNSILLNVNGVESFGNRQAALILNGENVIGVNIAGTCANLFFDYNQIALREDGQTAAMIRGTSGTPIKFNAGEVSFEADNQTYIDYGPDSPADTLDARIDSLFLGMGGPFTGLTAFKCSEGTLKVRGGSLFANTAFDVTGGQVAVSMLAIAGNIDVTGGNVAFDTVGQLFGDVTVSGAGSFQFRGSNATGNLVTSGTGGASIKCDTYIGDITIGAGTSAYLVINNHVGTLTNNGTINGIVNGVYYGNWRGLGYILATWGANLQTVGRHPAINSPANSGEIASLGIFASMPVPADGTLDTITYYSSTGDNTTTLQIVRNGVVEYTFSCDAAYGVETGIGLSVNVLDNVAIRYSAGTAPSEGLYTAYVR